MTGPSSQTLALAPTPPMGWMSWNSFGHDLSEEVVLGIADALERTGLAGNTPARDRRDAPSGGASRVKRRVAT